MGHSISPMRHAIKQAMKAVDANEVPIGAVLVDSTTGEIVAKSHNTCLMNNDPTQHAEINVIRTRCADVGTQRLPDHDLYVTLEPCPMCAAAISNARIRTLYFGAYDPKSGGVDHGARVFSHDTCHHKPDVIGGIEETACAALLKDFFGNRR